jgi:hypothetical protein
MAADKKGEEISAAGGKQLTGAANRFTLHFVPRKKLEAMAKAVPITHEGPQLHRN